MHKKTPQPKGWEDFLYGGKGHSIVHASGRHRYDGISGDYLERKHDGGNPSPDGHQRRLGLRRPSLPQPPSAPGPSGQDLRGSCRLECEAPSVLPPWPSP
ncbi:hypothetical protein LIER_20681 [Lithospermum erythrorhizon]|uniref:Uncharacterized protein n=1 Tax=Lithospermum erythrorhizon TaxID=34254 RepID=A0AAV3QQ71_LITER